MSRRILVTGGAGYIGSHTCKALALAGFVPVVLDNLQTGHARAVNWGPLIVGNVGDRDLVLRVLSEERIDAIIHFAASAYVGESVAMPEKYFANNVIAGLGLLDAVLLAGVRPLIFSSTCATYGVPRMLPLREDHPQVPINPYGESKLFFEKAIASYGVAHHVPWMALRYFNAAGADLDGELGEDHEPETHLIPNVLRAVTGAIPHISIFGTDYPTQDGTAVRDYIHVADLAGAHVCAVLRMLEGVESAAYNLGTGKGVSVKEILTEVTRVTGRAVPVVTALRRPGDPPTLIADASAFRKRMGWAPTRSDLATIVESAWRWHRRGSKARSDIAA